MRVNARVNETIRFWDKVLIGDGCWEWQAFQYKGYGRFKLAGQDGPMVRAHRYAYEQLVGPIPSGLVLDHLCRNTRCVRPDHLEPVTERVNLLRSTNHVAVNAAKTECVNGHPLSGENLFLQPNGERFRRICRACARDAQRAARARKMLV